MPDDSTTTSAKPSHPQDTSPGTSSTDPHENRRSVATAETKVEQNEAGTVDIGSGLPIIQQTFFIASICVGQFLTLAPNGQVLAPLRIIGASFGTTEVNELSWYLAAYALTAGTFVIVSGSLGDRFGFKRCFLLSVTWLGIWSFILGFTVYTQNQVFFDICRAFQGLGGAMLAPSGLAILGSAYGPGTKKAVLFSLFGAMSATGFFLETVFASIFAQLAWWPWIFWSYAIACAIVATVGALSIPPQFMHRLSDDTPANFDWLGSFFGTSGLILFNVAWNLAPSVNWAAPGPIVLLILGIIFFGIFIFVELRAESPLVPIRAMSPGVILVLLCVLFGWMSFGVQLYYWWQFVEVIQGAIPLQGTAWFAPGAIFALIAAGLASILVTRLRSCWIMFGAELAFLTGNMIFATLDPSLLYWKQNFWILVITPFGIDLTYPAASLMLSNLVKKEHQGVAAGLIATFANYSLALGIGFGGTVEVNVNEGGMNVLGGYRGAMYWAIGSSGLGLAVAIYLVIRDYTKPLAPVDPEKTEKEAT